jgi:hypothetical protein
MGENKTGKGEYKYVDNCKTEKYRNKKWTIQLERWNEKPFSFFGDIQDFGNFTENQKENFRKSLSIVELRKKK